MAQPRNEKGRCCTFQKNKNFESFVADLYIFNFNQFLFNSPENLSFFLGAGGRRVGFAAAAALTAQGGRRGVHFAIGDAGDVLPTEELLSAAPLHVHKHTCRT